jgi:endogenous inhibitor of DNA gyrase (YacG/DUF329 family)
MTSDNDGTEPRDTSTDIGTVEQDRQVSIECGACGRTVPYSGTGRRPKYCSDTCRKQAWALREAARRAGETPAMPTVVREVIARETVRTVRVAGRAPRNVLDWARHLETLAGQLADDEHELHAGQQLAGPWQMKRLRYTLTAALKALDDAYPEVASPPPPNAGYPTVWGKPTSISPPAAPAPGAEAPVLRAGLSRQQRRALEREQRKRPR